MLRFFFGRPGSGKTQKILEELKTLALEGKEAVFVIPEQFSFESERAVLKALGDQAAQRVSVMSFTRLCDEVARQAGGLAGTVLSQADKVILMTRALRAVADELTLWKRYCRSVSFAKTVLDTVGELKIGAVTPSDLREVVEQSEEENLRHKIHDLSRIYETYDALVGEAFLDPADNLTKLYQKLETCRFFENKAVFVDSFKGFTGQQYRIIDRMLAQADDVTIAFTNDPALTAEYNVYHNIRAAAERIRKAAGRFGQKEEVFVLQNKTALPASLSALERWLAGDTFVLPENDHAITVCRAKTQEDEAEFAARTIRRLVHTEGYRYRDFVVIARDAETYEDTVTQAFSQNAIPVFSDKRLPLSSFPLSAAASAATRTATQLSGEQILRFHKTGLGTLSASEIARLENYVTLWNIDGALWEQEWNMDPRGFVSEREENRVDHERLAEINTLREKALSVFSDFQKEFEGTAAQMAAALVHLFEKCDFASKLAVLSERFAEENTAFSEDTFRQAYAKWMGLLDSIARCFGNRTLSKSEFTDAMMLAVSFETIGVTPRMLDEVTFGSADRIRPSHPKVAFVLGANQGVFPKEIHTTGLLGVHDRQSLIALGLELPDDAVVSVINEAYLVYGNLCCASDRLFLSYSSQNATGSAMEPAAFLMELMEHLPTERMKEPADLLGPDHLPETAQSAYARFCRAYGKREPGLSELRQALLETGEKGRTEALENRVQSSRAALSRETAQNLFGREIHMSASRFDRFHRCPFSYFCLYGLKAQKLRPADFDVLQRGTLVHVVLERFIREHGNTLDTFTREQTDGLVDTYIKEYLDGIAGYASTAGARTEFLVSRISRSLKEVVWHMIAELRQSDFVPVACEMKIGPGGELPALEFPFDGGMISLTGSIDRVDRYQGYIRVIDYKTGSRQFKLPDILFGLNLQMLIYLYAATRAAGLDYEKAAGILYMPAKRDTAEKGLAMNGLIRAEENLVTAMD
ncbi:MAG: exodeoxyribonuclease V subunit gamma, partial [Clostridia bacterium]|nr:exodeoxyribonuclease V subunit gamma [Clostridia bacterium]